MRSHPGSKKARRRSRSRKSHRRRDLKSKRRRFPTRFRGWSENDRKTNSEKGRTGLALEACKEHFEKVIRGEESSIHSLPFTVCTMHYLSPGWGSKTASKRIKDGINENITLHLDDKSVTVKGNEISLTHNDTHGYYYSKVKTLSELSSVLPRWVWVTLAEKDKAQPVCLIVRTRDVSEPTITMLRAVTDPDKTNTPDPPHAKEVNEALGRDIFAAPKKEISPGDNEEDGLLSA